MNGLDQVLVAMLVIAVGPTWGWHDRGMEMWDGNVLMDLTSLLLPVISSQLLDHGP